MVNELWTAVGRMYARSHFPFAQSILRGGTVYVSRSYRQRPRRPSAPLALPRSNHPEEARFLRLDTVSPANGRRKPPSIPSAPHPPRSTHDSSEWGTPSKSPALRALLYLLLSSCPCLPPVITVTTDIPPPCLTGCLDALIIFTWGTERWSGSCFFKRLISTENRIPVCYRITGYRNSWTISPYISLLVTIYGCIENWSTHSANQPNHKNMRPLRVFAFLPIHQPCIRVSVRPLGMQVGQKEGTLYPH
jgi:hypothetical protein